MACTKNRWRGAIFHTQTALVIYLDNIFLMKAVACESILQAALKYKPRDFFPWFY